jgi:hypothetical protein
MLVEAKGELPLQDTFLPLATPKGSQVSCSDWLPAIRLLYRPTPCIPSNLPRQYLSHAVFQDSFIGQHFSLWKKLHLSLGGRPSPRSPPALRDQVEDMRGRDVPHTMVILEWPRRHDWGTVMLQRHDLLGLGQYKISPFRLTAKRQTRWCQRRSVCARNLDTHAT